MSCKEKEIKPKEANMTCNGFFVKGEFKNGNYTFCGIVPVETQYIYKNGNWKFWNLKGQLIAEGFYKLQKIKVEGQGGCPYEITEGIIDKERWNFWDDKGQEIKPKEDLITKLEACTTEILAKN